MTEKVRYAANPFLRVGPRHDLFIPRHAILADMREAIASDRSLALVGEKGTGKSSLIRYLFKRYFDGREFQPHALAVWFEMPGPLEPAEFLRALHHRLHKEIDRRGLNWGEVPWVKDFSRDLPDLLAEFDRLFEALLDERLSPVLVIEPLDATRSQRLGPLTAWLAGWMDRGYQLMTTAPCLEALPAMLAERMRAIPVGALEPEEARLFLTRPLEGHAITFSEDEIRALLTETGGHPAKLHDEAATAMTRKLV